MFNSIIYCLYCTPSDCYLERENTTFDVYDRFKNLDR